MDASRILRFLPEPAGIHYAVRIFLGTAFLWILLRKLGDEHAIWAIIAMIFIAEPHPGAAMESFRLRILNTLLGCGIAMTALLLAGPRYWILPVAVTIAVLFAVRAPQSPAAWRVAPIAAAVVLAAGIPEASWTGGMRIALIRAGEVLIGGATALSIAWLLSRVWMPDETDPADTANPPEAPEMPPPERKPDP